MLAATGAGEAAQAAGVGTRGGSRGSAVRSGAPTGASFSLSAAAAAKITSSYANTQTFGGCGEENPSLPLVPLEEPGELVAAPSRTPLLSHWQNPCFLH